MNNAIYTEDRKFIIKQLKSYIDIRFDREDVSVAKLPSKTQFYVSRIELDQRRINIITLK